MTALDIGLFAHNEAARIGALIGDLARQNLIRDTGAGGPEGQGGAGGGVRAGCRGLGARIGADGLSAKCRILVTGPLVNAAVLRYGFSPIMLPMESCR